MKRRCPGDLQATLGPSPSDGDCTFLDRRPAAAYMSKAETWRELSGGEIEFIMRRLRSAD
ncbi:hypothetical protein Nham_0600 [Nitrobacter hamburgensis X14]|uniref:Uncharacterized protein n=1 Tax=Nitrobacter hamburgensis (strain DSM 10229 / NCIMB 13809 / X14) TaxID=323097 RepID=Q1QQK8_NITHX|nr:hypothetical protein Nham_0600 [Nitrobacter hamburgensis X14]